MLKVEHLHKYFGDVKAVQDVSLTVKRGEILGFLGPNGAGKTTTMKVVTGFLQATDGKVLIDERDASEDPEWCKSRLGYVPEQFPLYEDMLVYDYLQYVADVRRIPGSEREARIRKFGALCGIQSVIARPISELSKGYRQRVGLTQAMLHDPDLLVLDEPTDGLDPNQKAEVRSLIRKLGQTKAVILSTHILPEVQQTCDRVVIINEGKVAAEGTPDELSQRQSAGNPLFHVAFAEGAGDVEPALKKLGGIREIKLQAAQAGEGSRFVIEGKGAEDLRPKLFGLAVERKWGLLELQREQLSLEDIFRRLTQS